MTFLLVNHKVHVGHLIVNTGTPQGCVLTPTLVTTHINDRNCSNDSCKLSKYADDTALVSLRKNHDYVYREEVAYFIEWCNNKYLDLHITNTKEMVISV